MSIDYNDLGQRAGGAMATVEATTLGRARYLNVETTAGCGSFTAVVVEWCSDPRKDDTIFVHMCPADLELRERRVLLEGDAAAAYLASDWERVVSTLLRMYGDMAGNGKE